MAAIAFVAILFSIVLAIVNAGPQQQLQCPQDIVPKVKAANEACDKEAGALHAAGLRALIGERSAASRLRRADEEDSDEDLDPDMVLCMFEKLKSNYPQLESLEKACLSPPSGGATTASSNSDEQDSDVQLATCLDEKMDKLCPELASVA